MALSLARLSKYSASTDRPTTVPRKAASTDIPASTAAFAWATTLEAAKASSCAADPPASCATRPLAMKKRASG